MRPVTLARLACIISIFSLPPRDCLSAFPLPSGPFGAPLERLCSSGKGGSKVSGWGPQPLFSGKMHFL
jgi:hypothetical protein